MFHVSRQIIRGLILLSLVNLAVVILFAWFQVDGALLGYTRPTIAIYGLLATILVFRLTWPHGKTTAGYLLVAMALACLLEAAIRTGHVLGGRDLLALLASPLIPAAFMLPDRGRSRSPCQCPEGIDPGRSDVDLCDRDSVDRGREGAGHPCLSTRLPEQPHGAGDLCRVALSAGGGRGLFTTKMRATGRPATIASSRPHSGSADWSA
ncbi:MAG: hypothetical protein ACK4S8_14750, partial [Alishewanella aestuarii]